MVLSEVFPLHWSIFRDYSVNRMSNLLAKQDLCSHFRHVVTLSNNRNRVVCWAGLHKIYFLSAKSKTQIFFFAKKYSCSYIQNNLFAPKKAGQDCGGLSVEIQLYSKLNARQYSQLQENCYKLDF